MQDNIAGQMDDTKPGKRQQLRQRNRLALIEAALDSVADKGISETSVSEIIQRAGLSRGMIHLHFGSKDNLMSEAVRHASTQYYDGLEKWLKTAGPTGQDRIAAIVRSDLSKDVLNRRNINIWYAFRGESRNRADIAAYSDTRDARLSTMIRNAYMRIVEETNGDDPTLLARDATHGTLAILEGMWTDFLLHPDSFDRAEAARIVFRFLSAMFPQHFDLHGAKDPNR